MNIFVWRGGGGDIHRYTGRVYSADFIIFPSYLAHPFRRSYLFFFPGKLNIYMYFVSVSVGSKNAFF